MQRREEGVNQSVEVFFANGGKLDQPHPAIPITRFLDGLAFVPPIVSVAAAIDGHFVPALDQPSAEHLGACLKTPVACGNPSRTQQRNLHSALAPLWSGLRTE